MLRTCTYNKNKCVPLKFRPALDVPSHNAAKVTEHGRGWRLHSGAQLLPQRARPVAGAPASAPKRSEIASKTHELSCEPISNLGCKNRNALHMTHELADASRTTTPTTTAAAAAASRRQSRRGWRWAEASRVVVYIAQTND